MTHLKWECSEGHKWTATPNKIQMGRWCPECGGSSPLDIKEMSNLAKQTGGKCLSHEYLNNMTNLEWECSEGHQWVATAANIKRGNWCPRCSVYINFSEEICRTTFEQLFEKKFPKYRPAWLINSDGHRMELDGYCSELRIAFEYQGEHHFEIGRFSPSKTSLNKRIKDDQTKQQKCAENHIVLFIVRHDLDLNLLPKFIRRISDENDISVEGLNFEKTIDFNAVYQHKSRIEEMNQIASIRGGKCLSEKYVNTDIQLKWECSKGHKWTTTPANIKRGTWCPQCSKYHQKITIEDMRNIALLRGGKCLSKEYIKNNVKLEWECSKGHRWKATPSLIKNKGSWCPQCSKYHRRITKEDLENIAEEKGGSLMSEKYLGIHAKHTWSCALGHIWQASASSVKNGNSWCPICHSQKKK